MKQDLSKEIGIACNGIKNACKGSGNARIMFAAPSSGSGKTTMVCGLLHAYSNQGISVSSLKCGPDYIDPMFHRQMIGNRAGNIDTFLSNEATAMQVLSQTSAESDLTILEGVMGFLDGVSYSKAGSSASIAELTQTPVILVINAKGMSRSVLPVIQGFCMHSPQIRGVILNKVHRHVFLSMKEMIEKECEGIRVYGYLEENPEYSFDSRHLGLMMPHEISDVKARLQLLSASMEESIDMEGIFALANTASELPTSQPHVIPKHQELQIGIASDEAFCFYYRENLEYLKQCGAKLCFFSPIHDAALPDDLDGLILGGGYPELYAEALSENKSLIAQLKHAMEGRLPVVAECGGYLYLHEALYNIDGKRFPMVGIIPGNAIYTGKLSHFGYLKIREGRFFGKHIPELAAHEFHYYRSESEGDAYHAEKQNGKTWEFGYCSDTLYAGFPHLYFPGNEQLADALIDACARYHIQKGV